MIAAGKWKIILDALFALAGIVVFAFFIEAPFPVVLVAVAGLAISGLLILKQISTNQEVNLLFGLCFFRSTWIYLIIGIQLGVLVGMFYRWHLSVPVIPRTLTIFALVAAAIGISEELFFRGYLQQMLYKVNSWVAIVFASMSHTAYKAIIFLSPFALHKVDVWFLIIWTFAVGLFFGWITKVSKSVLPAVCAHAFFDIWVYGQLSEAPWWVW